MEQEIKLEKVVKTYYDTLEKGKVLGRKCPVCGNVEWPPVYACNACGSYVTEWCEMSDDAMVYELFDTTPMNAKPAYRDLEPYVYAEVRMKEGPERFIMCRGISKKNFKYVSEHLPYPCHFDIVQRDGFKTAVFAIDPVDENGNPIEMSNSQKQTEPVGTTESQKAETTEATPAVPEDNKTLQVLKKLFAKAYCMDINTLTASSNLDKDFKGPSVIFVGLAARMEDEFDIEMSMTLASSAKTLGGLAMLIESLQQSD